VDHIVAVGVGDPLEDLEQDPMFVGGAESSFQKEIVQGASIEILEEDEESSRIPLLQSNGGYDKFGMNRYTNLVAHACFRYAARSDVPNHLQRIEAAGRSVGHLPHEAEATTTEEALKLNLMHRPDFERY